ncbi:glyoxylase-like metal-dependent hydrolase (beta-lactamase superfamily II) [Geothermobacter ehrlichii]|uniref:Glyoxylase-like metal-dependent hydrolase (Beta-lactamase superfamily II) n=1 Tax=Geothermobacter ehrlichii TaxID=213224 RepID=A0A5D3WKA8_9BACT|nr:MBL fold metallo-hydrolase [Geothermobacter ehrlichii]TYO99392.1 glyoxylase-like metal-dependent hydrolase (beta-lactamase superfamily II) [Geothermobacter ehrlichii]
MTIVDSVAAVFCHQGRIFAVRRQPHLNVFPGYDSFPGGKIDRQDSTLRHAVPMLRDCDGRAVHALEREIREELGYDLAAGIATGEVLSVQPLATVLAPPIVPLRFRLHFFRVDLRSRPRFRLDSGELAEGFWQTPRQLLERFERGDALMVPPLRRVLAALVSQPDGARFGDLSLRHDEESRVVRVEPLSGVEVLPVPSRTFPPERRTNAFLLGDDDAPRILVDPSPESPQVFRKLLRTLQSERLDALFLTHHHLDHHEHAPQLARHLNVPVWLSEDTRQRILGQHGADYFSGIRLETRREGDELTRWKGEAVRVFELPGHDAGQLGLAPESLRWFLVGDLVQSYGTVVISAPEGDMAAYFRTLEKLIALEPAVIIPSHGMPMRSTLRLRQTLQHRRQREAAILKLHSDGKSPAEILDHVYQGVEDELRPYALRNIESHLAKLRREGRI